MPDWTKVTDSPEEESEESSPAKTPEVKGDIETPNDAKELQMRLKGLQRAEKTWQQEQGIHVLYVTVGALHWKEAPGSDLEFVAPLVLIPVGLEKEKKDDPFRLVLMDDDVILNPALLFKLENDHSITIPSLPEEASWDDVTRLMSTVEESTKGQGWSVTQETWLTKLSFQKMVMYSDLGEQEEVALNHPIIQAIGGGPSLAESLDPPELKDLNQILQTAEAFPVLDADSSQVEALVRARSGQNMIVYGPPGTGKSQTIVNLISQFLRDGKKVLFVSEKLAALEVVFRRLKDRGLDVACLELHRHDSKKSRVIAELATTLADNGGADAPQDAEKDFERLRQRQMTLNKYVRELHTRRGGLDASAFQIHGELARYDSFPDIEFEMPTRPVSETTPDKLDDWQLHLRRLTNEAEVWNGYDEHPWRDVELDIDRCSLESMSTLMSHVKSALSLVGDLENRTQNLAGRLGHPAPTDLKETERLLGFAEVLTRAVDTDPSWLQESDPSNLAEKMRRGSAARESYERLSVSRAKLAKRFNDSVFEVSDLGKMLKRFETEHATPFRFLKKSYRDDIRLLREHSKSVKMPYATCLGALKHAVRVVHLEAKIRAEKTRHADDFGRFFKGEQSDWKAIETGLAWSAEVMSFLKDTGLHVSDPLRKLAEDPPRLADDSSRFSSEVVAKRDLLLQTLGHVRGHLKSVSIEGGSMEGATFADMQTWLSRKTNLRDLTGWMSFHVQYEECASVGLGSFLQSAARSEVEAVDLEGAFMRRFYMAWISEVYSSSKVLRDFKGDSHENIIQEFRDLDRKLMDVSARLVLEAIRSRKPKRTSSGSSESELGILLKEVNKRKRHRPLRRLFSDIPHLLQELKPCMLMSPLSVATYIPKGTARFDVVIFDEASQVKPEDAIGAIIRGDQLIVVGDNKQLPPTNFFDRDLDSEEEEVDDLASLESILDECASTPGFKAAYLNWHYRSRYEELIAFSNRKFYDSRLVTFPGPQARGASEAVRFVQVEGAVYDRGGSRSNRLEAERVVELVTQHLKEGRRIGSIGVIALSLAQEEAILKQWEIATQKEPDLEVASNSADPNEPMFIKSLEKVQGDERDFIFLSVGYGPDQNGVVHMNFGPVNRAGGERRLNVAITRARQQTTVVSSMLPSQLDLARLTTQNAGVEALRDYLEYAYRGGVFPEDVKGTGTPESVFEEMVKEEVERRGYTVDCQIGVSGFRIDLAVVHPDHPSNYILGIECDGATYHSHKLARERDRLRQDVLERLGWRIHRIWSTDWIKDQRRQVDKIVQSVEDLRVLGPGTSCIIARERPSSKEESRTRDQEPSLDVARELLNTPNHERDYDMPKYARYSKNRQLYVEHDLGPLMKRMADLNRMIKEKEARLYSPARWNPRTGRTSKPRQGSGVEMTLHKLRQELRTLQDECDEYDSAIFDIVQKEAPIHVRVLCERLRSTCTILEDKPPAMHPATLMSFIKEREELTVDEDFLFPRESPRTTVRPRVPNNGEDVRLPDEIHTKELAGAIRLVADAEFALPKPELVRLVARAMGYDRTGTNIEERILKALKYAKSKGVIIENNGQITPASDN